MTTTVAGPRAAREIRGAVLDRRRPPDRHPGPQLGQRVDDELAGHALRPAPRARRRRRSRRRRPRRRAPRRARARGVACASRGAAGTATSTPSVRSRSGRERRRDLGRVVRVVVVDRRRRRLAAALEPPRGAAELGEHRCRVLARSTPQARARRAQRPRCGGCARPRSPARPSTARAPRRARPCGTCASQRSKSSSTSARDANVAWWSRSTFVTTAIAGRSSSIVRSDSSPSTTSQPAPGARVAAELRDVAADQPGRVAAEPRRGRRRSSPSSSSCRARRRPRSESRSETSSASSSARRPARHAVRRTRVETNASQPSGGGGGSSAIVDVDSRPRTCSRYGVRTRSQPRDLGAPRAREQRVAAHARAADADEPESASVKRRSSISSSAISSAASGRASLQHRGRHLRQPTRIAEQRANRAPAHAPELALAARRSRRRAAAK